jgi:tRNA1Val (adenine37-N6)-methyltransferase
VHTIDTLLRGQVTLVQPKKGFRAGMDALWLSHFSSQKKASRALDLGSGVGAIGLCLIATKSVERVTFADCDDSILELAHQSAQKTGCLEQCSFAHFDAFDPLPAHFARQFDLVVANPPFETEGHATAPADSQNQRSRIGKRGTLAAFVRSAHDALAASGRACLVWPARDLAHLLSTLHRHALEPKRLRLVHPDCSREADVVMVEAKRAKAGGLRVEPPFFVRLADGSFTEEAFAVMEGRGGSSNPHRDSHTRS